MFQDVKQELTSFVEVSLRAALLEHGSDENTRSIRREEIGDIVKAVWQSGSADLSTTISEQVHRGLHEDVKSWLGEEFLLGAVRSGTAELHKSLSELREELHQFKDMTVNASSAPRSSGGGGKKRSASPLADHHHHGHSDHHLLHGHSDHHHFGSEHHLHHGQSDHHHLGLASSLEFGAMWPTKTQRSSTKDTSAHRASNHTDISYSMASEMLEDDYDLGNNHHTCGYLLGKVRKDKSENGDKSPSAAGATRAWPSLRSNKGSKDKNNQSPTSSTVLPNGRLTEVEPFEAPQGETKTGQTEQSGPSADRKVTTRRLFASSFHGLLPQGTRMYPGKSRRNVVTPKRLSARKKKVVAIVNSREFEVAVAVLLVLNAAYIGVQVDYLAQNIDSAAPAFFTISGWIFCICFVLEVGIRMYALGWSFFCVDGWKWNVFDLLVVTMQVCEETADLMVDLVFDQSTNSEYTNFTVVRVLRVLRLVRVVRFMRILRLIRELHTMVGSIVGSIRSFLWTIALLLLMIFIFGVYLTQHVVDHSRSNVEAFRADEKLQQYWGSLGSSVLSLFQALSGGIDWDVLLIPLKGTTRFPTAMSFVFAAYIAFAMFVVLNLVTGIFVDSAQTNVREDRDLDLVNRVRELFMKTDDDNSGCITWTEFESQLRNPQMEEYFKTIDLDMSEAPNLFNVLDIRGTGYISAEEFVNGCLRLRGSARAFDFMVHIHHSKRIYQKLLLGMRSLEHHIHVMAQELNIDVHSMAVGYHRDKSVKFRASLVQDATDLEK